jgi:2-polyprenyl-3-methyl-5-hydroxy-6-metoxy-1,4-benzoquinol methylase
MQLFKMTAEDTPEIAPDVLSLYNVVIKDTSTQIEELGSITPIDELSIHASVTPKSTLQPNLIHNHHSRRQDMKANYDSISEEWCKARKKLPPRDSDLFDYFMANLPDRGKILDMGCGSGVPITAQLAEAGFSVHGIDRSKKLLDEAKMNVPTASFEKAEIEEYHITGKYNAVILWDSLFHIPREKHSDILKTIFGSIPQDGLLMLSSGGSKEDLPPFTDFMFGTEFFYDSFTPEKLLGRLKEIGFSIDKYVVLNEPDGERDKGRIGIIALKT